MKFLGCLQHTVLQQVVERGIDPLDHQCRQTRHCGGGGLNDVAHEILKAALDAFKLFTHRHVHIEVAADEVGVPGHITAEAQGLDPIAGRPGDWLAATDAVVNGVIAGAGLQAEQHQQQSQHPVLLAVEHRGLL